MTQRRGGRPKGPARVPYTTTLLPDARAELSRRAVESFGTERAANRVIEEAMGFAAVRFSETEDVELTIERDAWTDEVTVAVCLYPGDGDAEIESLDWADEDRGELTQAEEDRAIEAAWRKREES